MDMPTAIALVVERQHLRREQMTEVMRLIMTGAATPAQIGGFLIGLRLKGETVEEIVAAVSVMRELASKVSVATENLVDIVGTGGDGARTFNISTASCFVIAAAGGRVAKHGNRSVSSSSGSADVLEAAGVNLHLNADQIARCIDDLGVGFMFAPMHHAAMKHAIGPRKEMGVRTIFNLLGPLTNPAAAPNQLLGVYSAAWVRPLAEALQALNSKHVLVVHAEDGLDEISIAAATRVAELKDGSIREYSIEPEDFGMRKQSLDHLRVGDAAESLALIRSVLRNEVGAALDIVALNAGAAIYVSGMENSLSAGVLRAQVVLAEGCAEEKLQALVEASNS